MALITFTEKGLYCSQADAYIDPSGRVDNALITHGHSDHARRGHKKYLSTNLTVPVVKHRLGSINIQGLEYGEAITINGVKVSFHPAGHAIGSAQARLEYMGEIWVVSGDYKVDDDGISTPYEPIRCHHFVTESTFGMPVFNWPPQEMVIEDINGWWKENKERGKTSILSAYSFGKAQRLIHSLDHSLGTIYTHASIEKTNTVLRECGVLLPETTLITDVQDTDDYSGSMVIAPPSAIGSDWMDRFLSVSTGAASGWMAVRATQRWSRADRGFVLSDHADWKGLNYAVEASEADHIYVTHGYADVFSRWLKDQGKNAVVVRKEMENES